MQIYKIETDANGRELTTHGSSDFPALLMMNGFLSFSEAKCPGIGMMKLKLCL